MVRLCRKTLIFINWVIYLFLLTLIIAIDVRPGLHTVRKIVYGRTYPYSFFKCGLAKTFDFAYTGYMGNLECFYHL